MDKLDFLDAPQGVNEDLRVEEVAPAIEPTPVAEAPVAPVETPEPQPEPAATPELKPVIPEGYVPLATVLDTRDKLKDAQAELNRLRQQQPQPQNEVPDVFEDPQGFVQHTQNDIAQREFVNNMHWSRKFAETKHGEETVQKAHEWAFAKCDQDPHFNAKVLGSRDPYDLVISEFMRDQIATNVQPDDYQAFLAWKQAQGQVSTTQPAAQVAEQPQAIPPRSIASAPSAGGGSSAADQPTGPGVAYASMFGN